MVTIVTIVTIYGNYGYHGNYGKRGDYLRMSWTSGTLSVKITSSLSRKYLAESRHCKKRVMIKLTEGLYIPVNVHLVPN